MAFRQSHGPHDCSLTCPIVQPPTQMRCGRNGKVVRRTFRRAELFAEGLKRRRALVVAVHVTKQTTQFVESCGVQTSVFLDAITRSCLELVEIPASLSDTDDRLLKMAALDHRLQCRKYFLVSQISGCPKK